MKKYFLYAVLKVYERQEAINDMLVVFCYIDTSVFFRKLYDTKTKILIIGSGRFRSEIFLHLPDLFLIVTMISKKSKKIKKNHLDSKKTQKVRK